MTQPASKVVNMRNVLGRMTEKVANHEPRMLLFDNMSCNRACLGWSTVTY